MYGQKVVALVNDIPCPRLIAENTDGRREPDRAIRIDRNVTNAVRTRGPLPAELPKLRAR